MTRRSKTHELIDQLEPRQLLTYTVTTTNANDLIEMQYNSGTFSFLLNSQPAGSTTDVDIVIQALGGNDDIKLYHVPGNADVTVRGGSGDDDVEVGNGRLADNLLGSVFVEELDDPDDPFDHVIIRDQLDNTSTDRPINVRASANPGMTHFIRSGLSQGAGTISFNTNYSDFIEVYSSAGNDSVYVEAIPSNLILDLGAGNDTAYYGDRTTHELPEDMPLGNVYGRDGTDRVIFDDLGQSHRENSIYRIDPSRDALNISIGEVEHIELTARPNGVLGTDVDMTGWGGATSSFTVRGENADVNIGTASTPIDLDSNPIQFITELGTTTSQCTIYDRDTDADGSDGWLMFRQANQAYQVLSKGDFILNHRPVNNETAAMHIHGGPRNDQFTIGGIMPRMGLLIDGGSGNDQVFTNNANFVQYDLDAIFDQTSFRFHGGSGFDTLSLIDSNDQINDGDADYNCVGIGDEITVRKGTIGIAIVERDVDKMFLTADSDDNTIFFHGPIGGLEFVADGGPGNDYMSNNSSLEFYSGNTTVSGGSGVDTLVIDDTDGEATQYTLTSNTFAYSGFAAGTWLYDSFESFTLDASENDSTIRIDSRIPTVPLFVGGRGGNDTITVGGGDFDGNGFGSNFTVLGGDGEDKIVVDDHLDDWNGTDADTFNISFQTINKDGVGLIYSSFESQKIITSGVNSSAFYFPNTVKINSTDMPTEIVGTPGDRDTFVDIGNQANNLGQIFAPITLTFMPGALATAYVHDETATAARQYTVTATAMTSPRVINYTGVVSLSVYGGTNGDNFNVISTSATMPVNLRGYNGDDFVSIGAGGPLAVVQSRVFVIGDAGNDTLFITNGPGGGFTDATITAGSYRANGGPRHLYETIESFWAISNDAGSDYDVASTNTATNIYCDNGNDTFHVGGDDITANIHPALYIRGGGGTDLVEYDDTLDVPNLDTYVFDHEGLNFTADRFLRPTGTAQGPTVVVTMEGIEQQVLHANEGNSDFQVYKPTSALRINANGGNDFIHAYDTVAPLVINTGSGTDYVGVNENNQIGNDPNPATAIIEQNDQIGGLQIFEGGTLRVSNGATLCQTPFTNGASILRIDGTLDVSGAYLYKPGTGATSEATFRTMIKRGRNGGAWNGSGMIGAGSINSSLAASSSARNGLGYGLGSQIAMTTIGPFAISSADMLIRCTILGDADLNGVVNFDDYSRIDNGFLSGGNSWVRGDFDYNDAVNFDDYALIDLAFNQQRPTLPRMGTY